LGSSASPAGPTRRASPWQARRRPHNCTALSCRYQPPPEGLDDRILGYMLLSRNKITVHNLWLLLIQHLFIDTMLRKGLLNNVRWHRFFQRVSIACYAERCTSYSRSVRLSVCPSVRRPSVTRWHCVKTTSATIMRSSPEDSDSSFLMVNITAKFQREHRERGRRMREGWENRQF